MDKQDIDYWKPRYEAYIKRMEDNYGYSKEYMDKLIRDVAVNDKHYNASDSSDVALFMIWQLYAPYVQPTKPPRMGKGIYISPEDKQQILDCADEIAGYYHISTNEVMGNPIWYIKKYISEIFGATHPKEDKNENRR